MRGSAAAGAAGCRGCALVSPRMRPVYNNARTPYAWRPVTANSETNPVLGTQDRIDREVVSLQALQATLQRHLASYGYVPVDFPVLERADLYLRKLGSQVAALLFDLVDHRGERLSLRPEFTGSAIRSYLAHAAELPLPVRWQYAGPVFRDRSPAGGALRQYTQVGCELIGGAGPRADAELIAAAALGLRAAGVATPRVVVGHAGLAPQLLAELQVSERARLYIASHLDLLRAGDEGAARLREGLAELERTAPASPAGEDDLRTASTTSLIQWFLAEGTTRPTGRRSPDQIVRRFREKVMGVDAPERLERALGLVQALAGVVAGPDAALAEGEAIAARYGLRAAPLAQLREVLARLQAYDLGPTVVEVDLGLHRPLGYYTGVVFELYAGGDGPSLGGGGRYDGLVRALGGHDDVAALGFAYEVERLEQLVNGAPVDAAARPALLVAAASDQDFPAAVAEAQQRRASGYSVELEVSLRSHEERLAYCRRRGFDRYLLVSGGVTSEVPVQPEPQYA